MQDDAQAAVKALGLAGTDEARAGIIKALSHPEYQVRGMALRVLAPKADKAAREALLRLSDDESAPVREELAKLIGQHTWTEGLPHLRKLLYDKRDYKRHPERLTREEPEYGVAWAAADALKKFKELPTALLDEILAFLMRIDNQTIDTHLHALLLDLLSQRNHPDIWTVLRYGLRDDHVVSEKDENLYPIRYAAAWAVVSRCHSHVSETALVPWPELREAADHIDPQLAAPALLALGLKMLRDCEAADLEALRGTNASAARVVLALSAFDDHADARALAARHGLLPSGHPFFDTTDDVSTDGAELERWPLSSQARDWAKSLKKGADVHATLRWMLGKRTGLKLGSSKFQPWDLRRKEPMRAMSMPEMFGME